MPKPCREVAGALFDPAESHHALCNAHCASALLGEVLCWRLAGGGWVLMLCHCKGPLVFLAKYGDAHASKKDSEVVLRNEDRKIRYIILEMRANVIKIKALIVAEEREPAWSHEKQK